MTRKNQRLQRWIIIALSLFAYAWRIQGLSRQSLWRDEIDAIYFALRDPFETLSMFVDAAQNGALFFLSLRPWLRLTGTSEFSLRYPAVLFGMLSIALLWQVGRRLVPSRLVKEAAKQPPLLLQLTVGSAPMLAAAFLAANPYQLWYSQDGKMYSQVTFLALLAVWFWLKGIDQGGWRPWLAYLVVVSIAMYTHLLMILLIPLGIIWFLIAWPQSRPHRFGYMLTLAGLTLPYLPMIWWQLIFLTSREQLTAFAFYPLPNIIEQVLLHQSYGVFEPEALFGLAPVFFLGVAGLFLGSQEIFPHSKGPLARLTAARRQLLIVAWLTVPLLGIYLLSLRQPLFNPHYVIWIAPAAMMLVALGVQLLWGNNSLLAKLLALVLTAYLLLFWVNNGQKQKAVDVKPDLRAAVSAVTQNRQANELLIVQIPYMALAYRYYSSDQGPAPFDGSEARLGRWAAGLWTNNDLSDDAAREQVARDMEVMISGVDNIWVLLSEAETWDERQLMIEWLDHQATLVDAVFFHGAQVRHYSIR